MGIMTGTPFDSRLIHISVRTHTHELLIGA